MGTVIMSEKNVVQNNRMILKPFIVIMLPIIIGVLTFILIYGFSPLDVTNDGWILSGYDETDIIQHYAGWLAYRNSEWQFPLGFTDNMAVGTGTIISFTDSIPIVAFILKIFKKFLPETFQYFGIYTLVCYILQSVAAFKILCFKTENNMYSAIGTLLFSFAPIFMERAFRHTALGSQWLVLFSIYLYLKHCEERSQKIYVWYLLLEVLAIAIHPYFLPMVAAFVFITAANDVREKRYIAVTYLLGIQIITYLFGVMIGVLGSAINSSRQGYGFYSMNINAIINPMSVGGYTWSSLLKTHPQILGNYDGFNYFGVGILVFIIITAILAILLNKWNLVGEIIKQHMFLAVVCLFLTCFAVSNVVTYNDKILIDIPLPEIVLYLCGIFRASSRLFYPVYYIIFTFTIILFWKILGNDKKRYACSILAFIVILQIFDIHGCIIEKRRSMNEKMSYTSYIEDSTLNGITQKRDAILLEDYLGDKRTLSVLAFKNNMVTYYSVSNSGNFDKTLYLANTILMKAKEDGDLGRNIIVTTNKEIADFYEQFSSIEIYETEGNYFIYSDELLDKCATAL